MFGIVKEEVSKVNSETGGFNSGHLWQLKKKLSDKRTNHTAAVLDKHGNLVTEKENIKEVTQEHYKKVLRNRTIKEGLETYQKEREDLCEARLYAARKNITPMWTVSDVKVVLKQLKRKKS